MARLLVTGATGTVGSEVARQALEAGWDVVGTYRRQQPPSVPEIEWRALALENPDAARAVIEAVRPDAIVHTAAIVPASHPHMWAVTAEGPARVALAALEVGARFVHISSDAIFDGTAAPYTEAASPSPITPYGAAKAAAEVSVAAIDGSAAIVRTSLVVRREPPDPQSQMVLDIAVGTRSERLFIDEVRCPVALEDLGGALLELVGAASGYSGVLHVAGPEALSRLELGQLVLAARGIEGATLPSWTLAESGLRRPADVRLSISRARALLRTPLRPISSYLEPRPPVEV